MATNRPPHLTLVANNDEAALFGRQAFDNLTWTMRGMAANLSAVGNGGGSTSELIHQLRDVIAAIEDAEAFAPIDRVATHLADVMVSDRSPKPDLLCRV